MISEEHAAEYRSLMIDALMEYAHEKCQSPLLEALMTRHATPDVCDQCLTLAALQTRTVRILTEWIKDHYDEDA